eukprot:gene9671-1877_t
MTESEEDKPLSPELWGEKVERYSRRENIGSGAFKAVFKAYDDEEGTEVAWNQIKITNVGKINKQKILGEITILEQLENQNIIKIFDSWESPNGHLIFITEIMSSGTLKQFIQKSKRVRLKTIKKWCKQILSGLEYLHSRETPIIHRDIKCDNIFLNGNKGEVKIGDLGLSICMKDKKFASSVIGTPEFMAPEQYEEFYDEKVDIYAFGMCVLEMVTGDYPYSECENAAQVYRRVTQGIMPQGLKKIKNKFVREFIGLCLSDKTQRPSATELLRHPFMQVTQEDDEIIFSLATDELQVQTVRSRGNSTVKEPTKPNSQSSNKTEAKTPVQEKEDDKKQFEPKTVVPKVQEATVTKKITKPIPKTVEPNSSDNSGFKVEIVDRKGAELDLKLFLRLNGLEKAIEFPFSLQTDTPEIVAQEMASELAMEEQDWIGVSDAIKFALEKAAKEIEAEKQEAKKKQEKTETEKEETQTQEERLVLEELPEEINFYEALKSQVPSENVDAIKLAYEALLKKHRLERENFYQFAGLNTTKQQVQTNTTTNTSSSPTKNGKLKQLDETLSNGSSSPSKSINHDKFEKSEQEDFESKDYLGYVGSLSTTLLPDNQIKSVKSVKASIDEDIHELMVQKDKSQFSTFKASPEESFENHQDGDEKF